ncbi:MAG: PDZ domain-containing protein [Planctomycetaceae bacterium]
MPFTPKRRLVSVCVLALAALTSTAARADDKQDALVDRLEQQAFKEASALVSPSVVQIQTTGGRDIVGRVLTGTGPTTGVVVAKDGYIITSSFNFIAKPSTILVNLADGRKNLLAKIVATDHSKMLTLIKIDAKDLPPAPATPKTSIKVGQWAIAMGRTYSADVPNVSVGIISALDRIWGRALQTDAKISPVNYGGPLVSVDGKVQGILVPLSTRGKGETAGVQWYDSGIGFAIPMEDVYRAVKTLKTGKDLHAGKMGASFKGAGLLGGAPVIDRVAAGSPSARAGLKRGDRIVEVDGRKIVRTGGIRHALGNKYAGDKITVVAVRDGKTLRKELTLVAKLEPYNPTYLGILPQRPFGDQVQAGVQIRHIFKGGPAEKAGLQRRDRIVKLNGKDVVGISELTDAVSRLKPKAKASVEYLRGNDRKTTTVTLGVIPDDVLPALTPTALPPGKAAGVKTGRFTVSMPKHVREYWAYVPENYNAGYQYTLMVWLHPGDDTMEATIYKQWKRLCDERGILILAPKAGKIEGFVPNELEYVKDAIDDFADKYSVDPKRVFLHSFDDGVKFAFQVAFRYPEQVRGVVAAGAAMQARPPGNSAAARQQFHFVCGSEDEVARFVKTAVATLRKLKYPTSSTFVKDQGHEYPQAKQLKEIARWADALDRI